MVPAVFQRDDAGQRDLHCEADGSVQDEIGIHCCETPRCASKMHHNDMNVGIQIALTSKTDALLNLQVSASWTLMKEPRSFLGSKLNGAAASAHLFKSKKFEIALILPEQLALEKSALVERQKSMRELERLRDYLPDAIEAHEFEDPPKPCHNILTKLADVLWASIVECCVLLGNVGRVVEGEADGVSKLGSDEQAKGSHRPLLPREGESVLGRRG